MFSFGKKKNIFIEDLQNKSAENLHLWKRAIDFILEAKMHEVYKSSHHYSRYTLIYQESHILQ